MIHSICSLTLTWVFFVAYRVRDLSLEVSGPERQESFAAHTAPYTLNEMLFIYFKCTT